MFADLLRRLTTTHEPIAPLDQRIALAALLIRVARSDGDFDDTEAARIDRILMQRYGMSPFEAVQLRADAETLEAEAPDTVRFTRAIKDAVPYEDREAVVEALWSVALADGSRDYQEDALLRLVTSLLGVSDRDSGLARQRAAKE